MGTSGQANCPAVALIFVAIPAVCCCLFAMCCKPFVFSFPCICMCTPRAIVPTNVPVLVVLDSCHPIMKRSVAVLLSVHANHVNFRVVAIQIPPLNCFDFICSSSSPCCNLFTCGLERHRKQRGMPGVYRLERSVALVTLDVMCCTRLLSTANHIVPAYSKYCPPQCNRSCEFCRGVGRSVPSATRVIFFMRGVALFCYTVHL